MPSNMIIPEIDPATQQNGLCGKNPKVDHRKVLDCYQNCCSSDDMSRFLHEVATKTAKRCAVFGISMMKTPGDRRTAHLGPMSVLPSAFPERSFGVALYLAPFYTIIYTVLSHRVEWLLDRLRPVVADDEFLEPLWDIVAELHETGKLRNSPIEVTHFRHDYMLDATEAGAEHDFHPIRLVETNTVSVGLLHLASKVATVHRSNIRDLEFCGCVARGSANHYRHPQGARSFVETLVAALRAWEQYFPPGPTVRSVFHDFFTGPSFRAEKLSCCNQDPGPEVLYRCVLMVVDDRETNLVDQEGFWSLLDQTMVALVQTLPKLSQDIDSGALKVDDDNRLIFTRNGSNGGVVAFEVCLVYYRSFYSPSHVIGPQRDSLFALRRCIEMSRAIKVPSLPMQLAGCKEVQRWLAQEADVSELLEQSSGSGILEQIVRDTNVIQVDPSDPAAKSYVTEAISDPSQWILKPQREGGGNNIHMSDLADKLRSIVSQGDGTRSQYVLMRRMNPPAIVARRLTFEDITETEGVNRPSCTSYQGDSELGIYSSIAIDIRTTANGVFYAPSLCFSKATQYELPVNEVGTVIAHENKTWILRTKPSDLKEGGVHIGFGMLDSPFLLDDRAFYK